MREAIYSLTSNGSMEGAEAKSVGTGWDGSWCSAKNVILPLSQAMASEHRHDECQASRT